jgi:hypothetical protein
MIRRLNPEFENLLAQRGLSVRRFALTYGLSTQTMASLMRPDWQPGQRTRGGMRAVTAWNIANAYAKATGMTPADAYAAIIIEESAATTDE